MYICWNLSKPASTPAPATPRRMLAPAPFIRDMKPSFFSTCRSYDMKNLQNKQHDRVCTCVKQSIEPLYLAPPPEVIIILLL